MAFHRFLNHAADGDLPEWFRVRNAAYYQYARELLDRLGCGDN